MDHIFDVLFKVKKKKTRTIDVLFEAGEGWVLGIMR